MNTDPDEPTEPVVHEPDVHVELEEVEMARTVRAEPNPEDILPPPDDPDPVEAVLTEIAELIGTDDLEDDSIEQNGCSD